MFFTSKKVQRNYELNRHAEPEAAADGDGMLNGQGRPALSQMRFGFADVGRAGCESIAVYNALRLLGRPRALPEIIRDMEKGGYLRFGGYLGATPFLAGLLRRYGLRCRAVTAGRLRREAREGALAPGSVFLTAIWNRRGMPHKGLHTFTMVYAPAEGVQWRAYNRFDRDRSSRAYAGLDDVLKNGRSTGAFLVIYRVQPRT